MRITVASGKGGTGKTTVATNLAATAVRAGHRVHLLDCDVEEPNCHLFIGPDQLEQETVTVPVPKVNSDLCTGCGDCAEICQFNALACLEADVITFPELCHSCGGCWLICPEKAIEQAPHEIGYLETGEASGLRFTGGRLRIGEAMVPPLIEQVKAAGNSADLVIVDSPPGTSCPAIAAMRGSDFVVLVTEPTPFGLHDLTLAVETTRKLARPLGVVVNRAGIGDDRVHQYCREEGIPVLLDIPDDRRVAEAYSKGILATGALPEMGELYRQLLAAIQAHAKGGVR
jgi:MinD superfamily P-loop ATPase